MRNPLPMYQTLNPATEELIQTYPVLSDSEKDVRVKNAREAFLLWRQQSISKRCAFVKKLGKLLYKRKTELARIMTLEMGKVITEAEHEIGKCILGVEYYTKNAAKILKEEVFKTQARKSYVRYDPLGVILGIMPWNFPFWQVLRFALPALLSGNVVLLKHAPNVPLSALTIEKLFREAGFPQGVFQTLFLTNESAAQLIASSGVDGVSLTGSSRAGAEVAAVAGRALKKTVLELGGSDPFIVFADADLKKTIPVALKSRMLNAGQSCIAAKRFIVHEKRADDFETAFLKSIQGIKVGDPTLSETQMGPLARQDLLENLMRQVKESAGQGAKIKTGGQCMSLGTGKGFFYKPTLLTDVKPGMIPFQEEIFGPVASIIHVRSEEEAIELANQTSYGLGASLWTRDIPRAEKIARQIEAGSVFINGMVKSDPRLPFGGIKKSGYGRELSAIGMHEFVNVKTVWVE